MVAETRLLEGEGRCAFQGLFDDGRGPRVVSMRGARSSAGRERAVAGPVRRLHDDPSRNRGQ